MRNKEERLKALRAELACRDMNGFVIPLTDEHMSEYVGAYAHRLAWLTGFGGSAGTAVVLADKAAIFVDGRYTLQAREEVDGQYWSFESTLQTSVAQWLAVHASEGSRIGYDPWLHTKGWVTEVRAALAEKGASLVAVETNPVDAVWTDQSAPSTEKLRAHPERFAGQSSQEKRRNIAMHLAQQHCDAVVLSALDTVAWTFNVRGQDVAHSPVALAFSIVHGDGTADFFVDAQKLSEEVVAHLGAEVRLHPRETFGAHLRSLADKRISVDPQRTVAAVFDALDAAGARVVEERDPVVLPKALKNAVEIAGHRAAQARDGAAICRFLHWLSVEVPRGAVTELSAAAQLRKFREATGELRDLSFETIAGFGPHGAIIHYHSSKKTNLLLAPGSILLLDSGGQYLDGTTDITRAIAIGTPTHEMRDRFTRVLKGHIALARAVFPAGTRGIQLDVLARQYLWAEGLDYVHGTSHGVGAYLVVHEGPQRIATTRADEPLLPGMILSNEPGYYKAGEYGVRFENLMLVVEREFASREPRMLGFEILSFAPIDRALIDVSMLIDVERAWIDAYHAQVARIVGPQLEGAAQAWLEQATRPLD